MELMDAIKNRRSIRKYKADPVEEEKLGQILEAVRWAPSWSNTQCWELIIVKDAETKERLSGTLPMENPAKKAVASAPIVLVACAKKGLSGIYRTFYDRRKKDWYMFDMGLAIQNLALTAHSLGLGTVNVGAFNSEDAGKIVGVPETVGVVELIPLGYPEKVPIPTSRKAVEDFAFYETYGNKTKDEV